MPKFDKKYLPNYLTILRLILVPVIFTLIIFEFYLAAFIFFLIANITDILDGRIARKYNLITDWGKLMDPLADKITQISTISALIIKGIIPFWILVIITIKELTMIIVAFTLYKKKIVTVHSKWYGKTATILLFLAIVFSLLSKSFVGLSSISIYIYYVAIGMTLFAGVMYGKNIVCKDF
jgi:cardiolipin synthase